jgi:peptide/nickel transport system substrate-binding protein
MGDELKLNRNMPSTLRTAGGLLSKIFALAFCLPLVLSGCGIRFGELFQSPNSAAHANIEARIKNIKSVEETISNPPYPGDYKLITRGSGDKTEELWQARGPVGKFGGTFRTAGFGAGPKTFNAWDAKDSESSGIGALTNESLIDTDPWTGKVYPRLARSIEVGDNGKQYIVKMRKGLKWSDGYPITADDVIFTYNTLIKKGFGNTSIRDVMMVKGEFPEVTKIDDLTVKFRTKIPFAPFESRVGMAIAPKHIMEKATTSIDKFHGFWDVNSDVRTIVGSGPFKLDRYVPGQRVEFIRNPNYAMVDKEGRRLPYLDKFVYSIVPDQNTILLKFYANEIDFLDVRSIRGSDAALIKQREPTGNFKLYNLGPDDGCSFLILNMNRRKDPKSGKFYVPHPYQDWFNNKYFRLAVAHAIDRKRIVDNILRGVGFQLFTAESLACIFLNKSLKPYPQDLELAAKLLEQGGFKKKGDRLYDAQGNAVEFTLNTNAGNSARDGICVMIQNDLKKLGMKVNYQPVDFNILIDKIGNSLDWQAVVMGLTGDRLEPYDGANVWKYDGRMHMFDQRLPDAKDQTIVTDARDWEKEIQNDFEDGATTLDLPTRHKYYDRFQQIVYDENPFIYLDTALLLTAMKSWVGNYMPTPLGIGSPPRGSLHNIEEIYLKNEKH